MRPSTTQDALTVDEIIARENINQEMLTAFKSIERQNEYDKIQLKLHYETLIETLRDNTSPLYQFIHEFDQLSPNKYDEINAQAQRYFQQFQAAILCYVNSNPLNRKQKTFSEIDSNDVTNFFLFIINALKEEKLQNTTTSSPSPRDNTTPNITVSAPTKTGPLN